MNFSIRSATLILWLKFNVFSFFVLLSLFKMMNIIDYVVDMIERLIAKF